MSKHSLSTVLGAAVLGVALLASPAFAVNNLFTVNQSDAYGVEGSKLFVPTFISMADPTGIGGTFTQGGIHIPYLGTMTTCTSLIGTGGGTCEGWGAASVSAWANGFYYDPRFGTPFIPPSGDHHRTGYRLLMQPSFSGGSWLSGFAPLNQRFPFFPEVGNAGPSGDVGLAMADASQESGLNGILEMADAHGEPLTTGKFPRYWPHERAAWVDTLMVKYTAGGTGSNFAQNLRSSVGFSRSVTKVRWRAMSNLDGAFSNGTTTSDGCGGPWCEFYVTVDGSGNNHLYVVKGADGNTDTVGEGTTSEITESTRLDTMSALTNGGKVLTTMTLNNLEKLPTVIDDRMSQLQTGSNNGQRQSLAMQFRVYSGPNVHSEEGADPYSWVICGTRGTAYGEADCSTGGGAIDAGGAQFAIVFNSNNQGNLGDSALKRMGSDLNPAITTDGEQAAGIYVNCSTSSCLSSPGGDDMYGTADDGTIYYREAIENGLRGWIRETNGHAFSFLGADDDGSHDGISPANFGLTQLVEQETEGFLISCLNCGPGHSLPVNQETVNYTFDWPGNPTVVGVPHPPLSTQTFQVLP